MYSDEYRSPDELEKQKIQELLSDPTRLIVRYQELVAHELRNKQAREQLKYLQQKHKKTQKEFSALQEREKDLLQKLGTAKSTIDAYRLENKRLKNDLKRLRSSKALRLSRAVSHSLESVKSPITNLLSASDISGKTLSTDSQRISVPLNSNVQVSKKSEYEKELAKQNSTSAITPISQRPLETLIEEFSASPTAENLFRVINRQWYNHGMIDAPAQLLIKYENLTYDFKPKEAELASRILGIFRLRTELPLIPPRSEGIAYSAEPRRVMYCVHSTPVYNSNGYSTRTRGVAEGLNSAGADVVVAARAGYPWDSKVDIEKPTQKRSVSVISGISYVHLPGENLNTSPFDYYVMQAADAFVREARLQRPSLIQAASNFRTALPALIAARRLGLPFVYEVRGLWEVTEASNKPDWEKSERYQQMAEWETLIAQEADTVLAITQQIADEFVRRGVSADKILLAPNAVDTMQYLPLPKDEQFARQKKIRTDVPIIGFAGSMVPYEGLDTLLDASAILTQREVEHQIVFAGSGASSSQLKLQRDEKKLRNVLFLGRLPHHEMPRLISTFDIMPCPRHSLPVTELVSPLKPLEAFSASKPVVLSDVAPHLDLAGNNERALIFEAGNAECLADAIQQLINNPKQATDISRAARLWTIDERTWTKLGEKMIEAHYQAKSFYKNHLGACQRDLSELRVGLIADEFTSSTLSASLTVIPLCKSTWDQQIKEEALDLIFIESAWNGNDGEWHKSVGYYGVEENKDIFGLLYQARLLGIPTIFWNKEDPVHFNRFRKTAVRCDHVFTTDANMVVPYFSVPWGHAKTVSSLPFYAQPKIHNPLESALPFEENVAFAGTYYGDRYKERSKQLYNLLFAAQPYGLTIYDRQLAFE